MKSIDISLVQKALWPLFAAFVLLGFGDALTTLVAPTVSNQLVEVNLFGTDLFRFGLDGYLPACALKVAPAVPLLYAVALPSEGRVETSKSGS